MTRTLSAVEIHESVNDVEPNVGEPAYNVIGVYSNGTTQLMHMAKTLHEAQEVRSNIRKTMFGINRGY